MIVEAFVSPFTGKTKLREKGSQVVLARVVAALCWPKGTKPGAVLALAEEEAADPVEGYHLLRLVDYRQEADVERLLEQAAELAPLGGRWAGRSAISVWLGDPLHPFTQRLRRFNEWLTAQGQRRINLRTAPGLGAGGQLLEDLAPYLAARWVGRVALKVERPELLAMIEDAGRDIRRASEDFPAVAALMWCVAYCDNNRIRTARSAERPSAADEVSGY